MQAHAVAEDPLFQTPLITLEGETTTLAAYPGRVLLIVNVASQCGFTPQYRGLEELYQRYGPRGLCVLGFPCNQFGAQEPGTAVQIRDFCTVNYGISFPLFAKIDVNGPRAHPLFRLLKARAKGVLGTEAIKWNFTKFLVSRDGATVERFAPNVPPKDLGRRIEALLA